MSFFIIKHIVIFLNMTKSLSNLKNATSLSFFAFFLSLSQLTVATIRSLSFHFFHVFHVVLSTPNAVSLARNLYLLLLLAFTSVEED